MSAPDLFGTREVRDSGPEPTLQEQALEPLVAWRNNILQDRETSPDEANGAVLRGLNIAITAVQDIR